MNDEMEMIEIYMQILSLHTFVDKYVANLMDFNFLFYDRRSGVWTK